MSELFLLTINQRLRSCFELFFKMDSIVRKAVSKNDYHVVFSMRNKIIKRTVGKICMEKIQDLLENYPFMWPSSTAGDVARGMIIEGDPLKCSCGVKQINNTASIRIHAEQETYQKTQMSIMLGLMIKNDFYEKEDLVSALYPFPISKSNIFNLPLVPVHGSLSTSLADLSKTIFDFISSEGKNAYSVSIVLLADFDGDSIKLDNGVCITISTLENEIYFMLHTIEYEGDQLNPILIDLVFIDHSCILISSIKTCGHTKVARYQINKEQN